MAWKDAAISVLIFLVMLNGAAVLLEETGTTDALGIAPQPGGADELEKANQSTSKVVASQGNYQTLFGSFVGAATTFLKAFNAIFAGPRMLINLGVPSPIVTFVFGPAYIIVGIAVAQIITGRFG